MAERSLIPALMDRRSNFSSGAVRRDSSPRPANFSYPWFGSRRKLESAFESLFILFIYFRIKPRRPADSCLFFGSHQILCLYIAYFLFVQYFFSPKFQSEVGVVPSTSSSRRPGISCAGSAGGVSVGWLGPGWLVSTSGTVGEAGGGILSTSSSLLLLVATSELELEMARLRFFGLSVSDSDEDVLQWKFSSLKKLVKWSEHEIVQFN